MKNITKLFFAAAFLTVGMASAQSGVGVGTTTPNASAALDVTSTTKGFLMPRMTTTERTAIATPANGLQVYDTTTNSQWYYNGTVWVQGASKADGSKFTNDATNTRVALTNLSDGVTARPTGKEFVITDAGNVGIGVSVPTQALSIKGNIDMSGNNVFLNHNNFPFFVSGTNYSNYIKGQSTTIENYTDASNTTSTNAAVFNLDRANFYVPNDDSWKVDTDLKFTIGVDGTSNNKLGFSLSKTNTNPGTSNDDVYFGVTEAGNVGIGVRVPTSKLDVNGYVKLASADAIADATPSVGMLRYNNGLQFHDGTSWKTVGTSSAASKWTNDASNSRIELTNLSDGTTVRPFAQKFYVHDNGSVTIGTANIDGVTLNVAGSAKFSALTSGLLLSTGGIAGGVNPSSNGAGTLHLRSASGTTPYIQFTEDGVAFQGQIGFKNGTKDFVIQTNGADLANGVEKFRLKENGNVGIGNSNPSEKLVVNGAITIGNTSTVAPVAGTIKFDGTNFMGWDGTQWVQLN